MVRGRQKLGGGKFMNGRSDKGQWVMYMTVYVKGVAVWYMMKEWV